MDDKEFVSEVDETTAVQEKRLAEMSSTATFPSQADTLVPEEAISDRKAPDTKLNPAKPLEVPKPQITSQAPATTPAPLPTVKPNKPSPLSVKPEHKTAFKHFWV